MRMLCKGLFQAIAEPTVGGRQTLATLQGATRSVKILRGGMKYLVEGHEVTNVTDSLRVLRTHSRRGYWL